MTIYIKQRAQICKLSETPLRSNRKVERSIDGKNVLKRPLTSEYPFVPCRLRSKTRMPELCLGIGLTTYPSLRILLSYGFLPIQD